MKVGKLKYKQWNSSKLYQIKLIDDAPKVNLRPGF